MESPISNSFISEVLWGSEKNKVLSEHHKNRIHRTMGSHLIFYQLIRHWIDGYIIRIHHDNTQNQAFQISTASSLNLNVYLIIKLSKSDFKVPGHKPDYKLQPAIQIFYHRGNTAFRMEYGWNLATPLSKILRKSIHDQNRKKSFSIFSVFFLGKIWKFLA